MEALNKESEFAAPVLTWAQKRSDLREKSTVGKFVRSSLEGLNLEDILLKLETILYYNYNWPWQMTRGWVLLLLNIRLHVKGFNKLIYIGIFK